MCGIFGYIGTRSDAAKLVLNGLKFLEYRGYDSWGVAVVPNSNVIASPAKQSLKIATPASRRARDNKQIVVKKRVGKIGEATVDEMPAAHLGFGHTRWATHGGVTEVNAHPHLDCTRTIAVIHNGIIENYEEIKRQLQKKGHRFVSETDTEVAAHLIEEYSKTSLLSKAVQKAFNELEGLNAIIVINTRDFQMVAVRNGSPLVVGFGNGENFLASDPAALIPHTKQVHFLDDDELAIVREDNILIFNARNGVRVRPRKQFLTWSVAQAEKGKYPYFMLKEIHEQPGVVADVASNYVSHAEKIAGLVKKARGTYLIGCGTASYAALAGSYLFAKVAGRHINWAVGSEFGYQHQFLNDKSLVIALSQSGETMDTLESVKKAKEKGAHVFAIVNVLGSTLYRIAEEKMLIGAGPEKGVASTKAFIGKLAHLTLLSYALAGHAKQGQKTLLAAAKASKFVLSDASTRNIHELARRIKDARDIYVIGRGLSYPASLETALKIKEISYIHAEGFAAGELKHGVIALVEKDTPCIAFLPNDETYGANLAGAMEMKARGGYIIGISHKPHEVFDYYIEVPDAAEATIIPNVIVAQLLAYYLTIEKGLNPDMPRNLAKSVTVK